MHIQIKAVNLAMTPSVDTYVREKVPKLEKLLAPHQNEAAVADVMLIFAEHDMKVTKDKCHITISGLGQGHTAHAETEEPEMHVAIDACVQKLEEQLRREKEKRRDHISKANTEAKQMPVEELMETEPVDETGEDGKS